MKQYGELIIRMRVKKWRF